MIRIWKHVDGDSSITEPGGAYQPPAETRPALPTLTVEEQEARALAKRAKLREAATSIGWLYALDTRDGLVKIGWTGRDLSDRLADYPPTFRLIVSIRGSRADERDVHRSLKLSRRKAKEWYEPTPEVVRQINSWIVIANTTAAQQSANRRTAAAKRIREFGLMVPLDEAAMKQQPTFLPRFVSLEDFAADRISLKPTGTDSVTHYRA